ncbi:MAG: hypothetical protein HOD26_23955 [Gammaproteobacteria bacterium]|nr:hypothetical protein [Gammaproteobacteria bacterium]
MAVVDVQAMLLWFQKENQDLSLASDLRPNFLLAFSTFLFPSRITLTLLAT